MSMCESGGCTPPSVWEDERVQPREAACAGMCMGHEGGQTPPRARELEKAGGER